MDYTPNCVLYKKDKLNPRIIMLYNLSYKHSNLKDKKIIQNKVVYGYNIKNSELIRYIKILNKRF